MRPTARMPTTSLSSSTNTCPSGRSVRQSRPSRQSGPPVARRLPLLGPDKQSLDLLDDTVQVCLIEEDQEFQLDRTILIDHRRDRHLDMSLAVAPENHVEVLV